MQPAKTVHRVVTIRITYALFGLVRPVDVYLPAETSIDRTRTKHVHFIDIPQGRVAEGSVCSSTKQPPITLSISLLLTMIMVAEK